MQRIVDIHLIDENIEIDELLQEKNIEELSGPIYARMKSIGYREFYTAKSLKFNSEIVFEVHAFEYKNQKKLLCEGVRYKILRSYYTDYDKVELTCEVTVNDRHK